MLSGFPCWARPGTKLIRFVASELNATKRPESDGAGPLEAPLPCAPSSTREDRIRFVPVEWSYSMMSVARLSSSATRLLDVLW